MLHCPKYGQKAAKAESNLQKKLSVLLKNQTTSPMHMNWKVLSKTN